MQTDARRAAPLADATTMNQAAGVMTLGDRLRLARAAIPGRLVFTTSFGLEDQVIADALSAADVDLDWVTLDTGRLFPETYDVWAATEHRYHRRIAAILPAAGALAHLVGQIGINGFYDSVANRHACCGVRKVAPLAQALAGAAGWLTGLRAEQSPQRDGVPFASFDAERGLMKINPLFDWPRDRLLDVARQHGIPVNRLHAAGFASIDCAPCTRALQPGEPERAGRWWWEADPAKECGLHLGADGRLRRVQPEPELAPAQ